MTTQQAPVPNQLPARIFLAALSCESCLVILYWLDVVSGGQVQLLHALFDLDSEGNIPAWFSSSQLFAVAITFFSCAMRKGTDRRPSRVFFILAGLAALYVSCDETSQIHERVTAVLGARYIDWVPAFAAQNFFFVMVFVAIIVTIGQLLAKDLVALWLHHRRLILLITLGVGIGLTGGMLIETLGYKFLQPNTFWYKVEVTVEEFMEMFSGSVILLSALQLRKRLRLPLTTLARHKRAETLKTVPKYQAVS